MIPAPSFTTNHNHNHNHNHTNNSNSNSNIKSNSLLISWISSLSKNKLVSYSQRTYIPPLASIRPSP
jgi:hypothetical protein